MRPLLLLSTLALLVTACGQSKRPTVFDCATENCEDCAVLSVKLDWSSATLSQCRTCQGAAQGTERACSNFPVRSGKTVVKGCNDDADCDGLSRFCGYFAQVTRNVCILSDSQ